MALQHDQQVLSYYIPSACLLTVGCSPTSAVQEFAVRAPAYAMLQNE